MVGGRTAFVIDGFNLYHSLVEASASLGFPNETGTKWLDLWGLCDSYMHLFGADARLVGVHYFSALAHHLEAVKPGVTVRHQHYADVLRATGVSVQFGNFKRKHVKCRFCKKTFIRHEEKETDVAVAMKVLEILHQDRADRVVLVTGDTDVAPAVRTAKALYLHRDVCFVFPWNRKMKELAKLADQCFTIDRKKYVQHQFPNPLIVNGRTLAKPSPW
jgi:Protein of unknown function DUF88.